MVNNILGSRIARAVRQFLGAPVERIGDVVVIRLKGRIAGDAGGDVALRDLVLDVLDGGDRKLLLNLSEISFIGSSGIGELVTAHSAAKERGGVLRVCNVSARVFSIFQMVQLHQVLDIREDEKDGLAAFVAEA